MVFKRRKPLGWLEWARNGLWPRGGWARAVEYIGHRLRRIPDSPHKVSLGLALGVFVTFTPFFGFHIVVAMLLAVLLRGNVLASVIGTFFGNPLTFPAIGYVSLWFGSIVANGPAPGNYVEVTHRFAGAFVGLWRSVKSLFGYKTSSWDLLSDFFFGLFVPYLIGGLIPGLIAGVTSYYVARPIVRAYQRRRRERRMAKFARRAKAAQAALAKELEHERE
ncbi:DUF2062 domain-containing protein [Pontivivens insulae]|uniref:DUF2062 domain-containing protein n=1 Tax=Pontivivens insulae TaxID=1639689 RepID=A0A2R8ADC7_9RHOB|nr:DUF2062 domain-containing protein [Pontivivens insulae]RED14178.1 hypothetical protein DFR53_1534 [Pontivivens insulae]SPF30253.1 hypothetical protein POI8812_02589 [Pontivivens insulae]